MSSSSAAVSDGVVFWTLSLVFIPPVVACLVYVIFKARYVILSLFKILLVLLLGVYSPQWMVYMLKWSPLMPPLVVSGALSFILYELRLPGESGLKTGGRIMIWTGAGIALAMASIDSNRHPVSIGWFRVLAWISCFSLAASPAPLLSSSSQLRTAMFDFISLFIIWADFSSRTPFTFSLVIGHTILRLILRLRSPSLSPDLEYEAEDTPPAISTVAPASLDYVYKPLDPQRKELRLLTLLSGDSSRFSDPIECQIGHFPLGRSPPYVALSYEWGGQDLAKKIKLDGRAFAITPSLDLALRRLRFHGVKTLWADAICINQNDIAEKNVQLERMFMIYQSAEEVAVWLGIEAHGSRRVMESLMHGKLRDFDYGKINLLSSAEIGEIDHFLSRPYWERVWIIQEIAAGKNVNLYCGQNIVQWENLERLSTGWSRYRPNMKPFQLVKTLCEVRASRRRLQTKAISLVQILALTSHSKSTDPLDKVYGLLGLASDWDRFIIIPDYKLHPAGLCLSMTESAVIASHSLDIILLGPKGNFQSELPSWCPNFVKFQPSASDKALISYLSGEEKYRFGKLRRRWDTTANSRTSGSTLEISNETLTLPGLRIGTVRALGCTLDEDSSSLQQDTRTVNTDSIDKSALFDALSRILLIYDEEFKFYGEFPTYLGWLMSWKYGAMSKLNRDEYSESVIRWLKHNSNLYIHGKTFRDLASSLSSSLREAANFGRGLFNPKAKVLTTFTTEHMSRSIVEILKEGFRLMTSDHGRVGWAHEGSKVGDHIYLFGGCTLPVILRPRRGDKEYTLVGHAYIDGVMDGQVWGNRGARPLHEVVIY